MKDWILVWDSRDKCEREGCVVFPWAHNAIQVRHFSLDFINFPCLLCSQNMHVVFRMRSLHYIILFSPLYNYLTHKVRTEFEPGACAIGDTVDKFTLKDSYAAEVIVAGKTCG
jgi:hypothetical protein